VPGPWSVQEAARPRDRPSWALLAAHRGRQLEEPLAAGPSWQDTGLVFATTTGEPIDYRNLARALERRIHSAGVRRIRFHDLRHCAASFQLAQGAGLDEIKWMLGHTQRSTTAELYTPLVGTLRFAAADRADALFPRKTAHS